MPRDKQAADTVVIMLFVAGLMTATRFDPAISATRRVPSGVSDRPLTKLLIGMEAVIIFVAVLMTAKEATCVKPTMVATAAYSVVPSGLIVIGPVKDPGVGIVATTVLVDVLITEILASV